MFFKTCQVATEARCVAGRKFKMLMAASKKSEILVLFNMEADLSCRHLPVVRLGAR